ncbi:hypothetical protein [Desulfonatronum parangueonense]
MRTETEIRIAGLQTLVANLGLVEAERFIALLSREPFDYTEWRKTGLPDMDLRELSKAANQYARLHGNIKT